MTYNPNEGFGCTLEISIEKFGPKHVLEDATCFINRHRGSRMPQRNVQMVAYALARIKDHPDSDPVTWQEVYDALEEAKKVPPPSS